MREFPLKFEETKEILMHPQWQQTIEADILEIGPGRGDLLFSLAQENPQKTFCAIEIGHYRYFKLVENVQHKALNNIQLVRADARVVLKSFVKPASFEKIFVLFPDPWPKNKHAFRRLLSKEWIALLVEFLKPNGQLICATDVPWYADWAFDNLQSFSQLTNNLAPDKYHNHIDGLTETYFQKKWKSMGLKLHFMVHQKQTV